jgi:PAP2 superfamily protein
VVRTSEWINIVLFIFLLIVAWFRPLQLRRRFEITAFGAAGIALTLAGAYGSITVIRDLLPSLIMLFVYWQSGRFFIKPNEWIQGFFLRLDERLVGALLQQHGNGKSRSWFANYLEFCYLLCYPVVPLGVLVLYAAGMQSHVDDYWTVVLISTYFCYCLLPFVQMLPPRALAPAADQGQGPRKLRLLNLTVLKYASIQVNTFPSAHVASTFAASLVLLGLTPVAGVIFLIIAIGIAGGAFLGRYHYAADVILGVLVACLVYLFL